VRLVLFGLCYYALAQLGDALSEQPGGFVLFWPPAGLFLAALLVSSRREWWLFVPAALIAALLANMSRGVTALTSLGFSISNAFGALASASLIRWAAARTPEFSKSTVVPFPMLITGAMFGGIVAAACGSSVAAGELADPWVWLDYWCDWWASNVLGVLLVAPVLLTWGAPAVAERSRQHRLLEATALALISLACAWIAFGSPARLRGTFCYAIVPCLVWGAVRFGPRAAAWLGFFLGLAAVWVTNVGIQAAVYGSVVLERDRSLQLFVLVMVASTLLLAGAVDERQRAVRRLAEMSLAITDLANTPLQTLLLELQAMARTGEGPRPAQLERMTRSAERLSELNRVIASFRPEMPWKPEDVSIDSSLVEARRIAIGANDRPPSVAH
jgi:integral membrane sensor domain MASE1